MMSCHVSSKWQFILSGTSAIWRDVGHLIGGLLKLDPTVIKILLRFKAFFSAHIVGQGGEFSPRTFCCASPDHQVKSVRPIP